MSDGNDPRMVPLPAAAEQALNQIADALGITTALLGRSGDEARARAGEVPSLFEASVLLQAYLKIEDHRTRQYLLDFIQSAARPRQ
ncbi:hypothetical protein [Methylobacterium planeticum]|uniref:Uncharacterized protein n=1 Tax=Methylobacterium planeticum TaxID=2615211 RepID=A0A6N6MIQ7_9HYPH|nr:hypothetical protein [Methylobacterium planeticum]KAB1069870.1 hypothetical protein F6X51_24435 [Methylobacterium planeticum]